MPRIRPSFALGVVLAVCALAGAVPASGAASGFVAVQTPSKNIGCALANDGHGWFVRCDIGKRSWRAPAKPRSCRLDYGQGVQLLGSGKARFTCAGDTVLGSGRVLGYGHSITRGAIRCSSLQSGMRCVNTRTHHGFFLSRQRVSLY